MTREDLKDDITGLIHIEMLKVAFNASEQKASEPELTSLCGRPSRIAAERVVQELERRARVEKERASDVG